MRLAIAALLLPLAVSVTPARSQDFSITNQVEPQNASRRDLIRQLQAWWDVHAYYPRHASNADEGGTVKLHLAVLADGRIWAVTAVDGSGSSALDAAAYATFRGGFVRPFPAGTPDATIDIALHYILAHRHDEPATVAATPAPSRRGFTITNDPVKSPILETMLLRTCTGTVVKQGIRNHPDYGVRTEAQAIFFRKPDGTPWVKLYEGGFPVLSPVTEVGKLLQWAGREEHPNKSATAFSAAAQVYQYVVWPDGEDKLAGSISTDLANDSDNINHGGTVDFTCATERVPPIAWSAWFVTPAQQPQTDPP